jgi:hypothetical protein
MTLTERRVGQHLLLVHPGNQLNQDTDHTDYLDNLLAAVVDDGVDIRSYFGWTLVSVLVLSDLPASLSLRNFLPPAEN